MDPGATGPGSCLYGWLFDKLHDGGGACIPCRVGGKGCSGVCGPSVGGALTVVVPKSRSQGQFWWGQPTLGVNRYLSFLGAARDATSEISWPRYQRNDIQGCCFPLGASVWSLASHQCSE